MGVIGALTTYPDENNMPGYPDQGRRSSRDSQFSVLSENTVLDPELETGESEPIGDFNQTGDMMTTQNARLVAAGYSDHTLGFEGTLVDN